MDEPSDDEEYEYPDSRDPKPRAQVIGDLRRDLKRIADGADRLRQKYDMGDHFEVQDYDFVQLATLVAELSENVRDALKVLGGQ